MSLNNYFEKEYFEWLYNYVCNGRANTNISYKKLFESLYNIQFTYIIPNDANRAADGIGLRYRYCDYINDDRALDKLRGKRCSVLEMMIALAIRCEETIMDNPRYGDRTKQWFWLMMSNLRLSYMTDEYFDENIVLNRIKIFLRRDYKFDGDGGLFYIKDCEEDLRNVEIWTQLLWYLDRID